MEMWNETNLIKVCEVMESNVNMFSLTMWTVTNLKICIGPQLVSYTQL
jgi:hypothetical protein